MENRKFLSSLSFFMIIFILSGLFTLLFPSTAMASRTLDWRDDGLWVISEPALNQVDLLFPPLADVEFNYWTPRIASISPDGEWIAFVKHTGGGYENEGQSCFLARWDGDEEAVLLETSRIIENLWWLDGEGTFYVVAQLTTGGTLYRSFFQVVDYVSGNIEASVEGRIYGTSMWGTRHWGGYFDSKVGLKYEVLSYDEEPSRWGMFYVDELIQFPVDERLIDVDGISPAEHPLTDGDLSNAWLADSSTQPSVVLNLDVLMPGISLQFHSGYQWHKPPGEGGLPWDGFDMWHLYDRPKKILMTFANGQTFETVLADKRSLQTIYISDELPLEWIEITIMSVYHGVESGQVAISEIGLY